MTRDERAALKRLLARPALERLWAAATAKLERYGTPRGSVRLDPPDEGERRAVADFLGLKAVPLPGRPLKVQLCHLDRTLRESRFAIGLAEALELHQGVLRDLPAERAAESETWCQLWDRARRHPVIQDHPSLIPWLEDIESTGLYRRLSGRGSESSVDLLERVLAVLAELLGEPSAELASNGIRLPVLASRVLGDSHALDAGHRAPALVLRAVAHIHRRSIPLTAGERRELWSLAGVVCDDLSCDVLVLGLTPAGDSLLDRTLREHAAIGEPLRITLRQLTRGAPSLPPANPRVFVCENPAVVSVAADRLAERAPPLVCLAGQPDTAALVLLRSLVDSGAELRYHGDFDWGGLRIANVLYRHLPFRPWRYTSRDYLAAVEQTAPFVSLRGNPVDAQWDGELCSVMEAKGLAVEEEAVIDSLLEDLERFVRLRSSRRQPV